LTHVFRLNKSIVEKSSGEGEAPQVLTYGVVNGTTLKYNGLKDVAQKLKLANAAVTYELKYKPSQHNNDEKTVEVKHNSKYEPSTGRLDNTETLKVGIPKVGPLRPWLTVSLSFPNHHY
jgi:hypothetical protein